MDPSQMLNTTAGQTPVLSKAAFEAYFGQGEPSTKTWYDANCHCGAVRFKFLMTDLKRVPVNHCNCSICTKNGYLMVYPQRDEIEWIRGYDALSSYRCSTKTMEHKFCPVCGSSVVCDFHWTVEMQPNGGDIVAVNVRMVKDFEEKGLNLRDFDSREGHGVPYQIDD